MASANQVAGPGRSNITTASDCEGSGDEDGGGGEGPHAVSTSDATMHVRGRICLVNLCRVALMARLIIAAWCESLSGCAAPLAALRRFADNALPARESRRNDQRRAAPHCMVVNLVRSGRKQP